MSKKLIFLIAFIEISLFLFLRFYNINNSLFFFNDMGRDLLVLDNWWQSGKPPLLGPQTSALPFNQSAIYFYLLYPVFLISNFSPLSALYTNAFIYISSFLLGLYLLKKHPKHQQSLLLVFFLVSIHPQYIIQSRFIWNPSLVTPFILISLYSLLILQKKFTKKILWLFSFSLATALSLTYSIAPFFITLCLLAFFKLKQKIALIATLFISLFLVNLPTLAFEIRHNFLLSQSLFTKTSPGQDDITFAGKTTNLSLYLLDIPFSKIVLLFIILICLYLVFKSKKTPLKTFSLIFLLTLFLNLIIPITIQAHYIFAYTSLLFIILSFLPAKLSLPIIFCFSLVYLQPKKIQSYFKPAPRTYQQMTDCYSQVCQKEKETLFVSVQSSYHPYHHGPEHRYLLQKAGCQIANIEKSPNATNKMALVIDGGEYEHQKTKFYELELFGNSEIKNIYECQPNFKVYILEKNAPPSF